MSLLFLSPKIQEAIVQEETSRIAKISERTIRSISEEMDWNQQQIAWNKLLAPVLPSA